MAAFRELEIIEFNTARFDVPVTALVPAWRTGPVLDACLISLEQQAVVKLEIIVCGPVPGSAEADSLRKRHPRVRVVASPADRGLAAALNRGIEASTDPLYVALVYPETQVRYDCLVRQVRYFRTKAAAGIVLPRVMDADRPDRFKRAGYAVTGAFELITLSENRSWPFHFEKEFYVPAAEGGCMLIRSEVFRCAGLFDEDYILGWEGIEFCFRAYLKGYRCSYFPETVVYETGRTHPHPWSAESVFHHCRGAWLTAAKHLSPNDLFRRSFPLARAWWRSALRFAAGGRFLSALRGEAAALALTRRCLQKRKTLPEPVDAIRISDLLHQGDVIKAAMRGTGALL